MPCDEWRDLSRRLGLPPQQAAIVELILQGKRDKQIASFLHLSHGTVRTHLRFIFRRLNVTDRVELVLRIAALRA
jgi:DNA-binding NarL/FixJ family response regulator